MPIHRQLYPTAFKTKVGSLIYKGKKIEVWEVWRTTHTRLRTLEELNLAVHDLPNDYIECECGYNSLNNNCGVKMFGDRSYYCCMLELKYD